jgi:hypothetical protein
MRMKSKTLMGFGQRGSEEELSALMPSVLDRAFKGEL